MTKRIAAPRQVTNAEPQDGQQRKLYVRVDTLNAAGEQIGTRIVDMYHFGTRNWLQNHSWWAMHNSHTVTQNVAIEAEVEQYIADQAQALADRFNGSSDSGPTAESIAA